MNAAEKQRAPKSAVARLIALIVVVIALFLTMKFLPVQQWLRSFNDWVGQMGAAGILIFIILYAVATVLLAPSAILTIGAGFAFGLWKGFVAVSAGATLAFLVARFIARDKVEAIARRNDKFRKIDKAIGRQGTKLIFLLRLSPVIPFNLSNYFYGVNQREVWAVRARQLDRHDARHVAVYLYRNRRQRRGFSRRRRGNDQT
jgi:uncharacterized membrane protein YdjX (TVP38/TMEM64 family)